MVKTDQDPPAELLAQMGQYLPPERLQHSVNVAQVARELALRHCPELAPQAYVAGLVHDNAKYLPPQELLDRARVLGLPMCAEETANPRLLHGKVGAALLGERFSIDDAAVGQAVADHVTGRQGMGRLSLVLYVADQIAIDREFAGVEDVRATAMADLDKAAAMVSRLKLQYVLAAGKPIVIETVMVYNALQSRLQNSNE